MQQRNLLLHTCCAPCFAYVHELLKPSYCVTSYFFNPNIAPSDEYDRRLAELLDYSRTARFPLIIQEPDQKEWVSEIKPFRFSGERSSRCVRCFRFRLERTFSRAREEGMLIVGTVLTISPHKDAGAINKVGKELEREYGIEFLLADFKKNGGFQQSVELSRKHKFYRQDYCGCMYSRVERQKDSLWNRRRALQPGSVSQGARTASD